jgi:hypothetical protein
VKRILALSTLVLAGLALAGSGAASAAPIISFTDPAPTLPPNPGRAAAGKKIENARKAPQNPFMGSNPWNNIHNDTWMTDAYHRRAPLGKNSNAFSGAMPDAICASLDFDSRGRIITICPTRGAAPQVRMIDPETLEILATYEMPFSPPPAGTPIYQNFAGGGYFYTDKRDRLWVPTQNNHIQVIGQTEDGSGFELRRDFDLTSDVNTESERMNSALPDFDGRIWFVVKQTGKVGTLDKESRKVRLLKLDEPIENSFTVAEGGVYVVTDRRMYRLRTNSKGAPRIAWKAGYRNTGIAKPGQAGPGSGTTPTILHGGYVAIADNADPMNVVVYRTKNRLAKGEKRKVCEVPVFRKGAGGTENTLVGAGRSLIVENNYGYTNPLPPEGSIAVTEPGFARVNVWKNGKGCSRAWTNHTERGASVVPKISVKTGLIYTYTMPPDPSGARGYYWTAIDFRTGETVWSRFAGAGIRFNNNYSAINIAPGGTAYIGVIGGIAALRDGN